MFFHIHLLAFSKEFLYIYFSPQKKKSPEVTDKRCREIPEVSFTLLIKLLTWPDLQLQSPQYGQC